MTIRSSSSEQTSADVWQALIQSSEQTNVAITTDDASLISATPESNQAGNQEGTAVTESGSTSVFQEIQQASEQDNTAIVASDDLNSENATSIENGDSTLTIEQESVQTTAEDGMADTLGDNESVTVIQNRSQSTQQSTVISTADDDMTIVVIQVCIQDREQNGVAYAEGKNVTAEVDQKNHQQSDQFTGIVVAGNNTTLILVQKRVQLNERSATVVAFSPVAIVQNSIQNSFQEGNSFSKDTETHPQNN